MLFCIEKPPLLNIESKKVYYCVIFVTFGGRQTERGNVWGDSGTDIQWKCRSDSSRTLRTKYRNRSNTITSRATADYDRKRNTISIFGLFQEQRT